MHKMQESSRPKNVDVQGLKLPYLYRELETTVAEGNLPL